MQTRKVHRRRMVSDMTPIIRKYPGYFVALSDDRRKVLGKGHTLKEALEQARQRGVKNPLLTKIPYENRSYLLFEEAAESRTRPEAALTF